MIYAGNAEIGLKFWTVCKPTLVFEQKSSQTCIKPAFVFQIDILSAVLLKATFHQASLKSDGSHPQDGRGTEGMLNRRARGIAREHFGPESTVYRSDSWMTKIAAR
jgi:hypothetical protein